MGEAHWGLGGGKKRRQERFFAGEKSASIIRRGTVRALRMRVFNDAGDCPAILRGLEEAVPRPKMRLLAYCVIRSSFPSGVLVSRDGEPSSFMRRLFASAITQVAQASYKESPALVPYGSSLMNWFRFDRYS